MTQMAFELKPVVDRHDELVTELVDVWEKSVTATHQFLTAEQIAEIKKYVPQALTGVSTLIVAFDHEQHPVGFMGIEAKKLEMIFLHPASRCCGLGKKMLTLAFDQYGVNEVVVNEDNPQAVGFYEHMGFQIVGRSELDEQGNPYPILFMKR